MAVRLTEVVAVAVSVGVAVDVEAKVGSGVTDGICWEVGGAVDVNVGRLVLEGVIVTGIDS